MDDSPRDPTLEALGSLLRDVVLEAISTSQPGRITAYDADTQIASVLPMVKRAHISEDDVRVTEAQPEIHSVPVMFWGTKRGRITWPVDVGDLCLVFHMSVSISRFLLTGQLVDPGNDRRHDINDAVAVVGLADFTSALTPAPKDAIVLHAGDGVKIKLGGVSGTERTIMADTFLDGVGPIGGLSSLLDSIIAAVEPVPGPLAAAKLAFNALAIKTSKTEVK